MRQGKTANKTSCRFTSRVTDKRLLRIGLKNGGTQPSIAMSLAAEIAPAILSSNSVAEW